jgi:hypothetical protein
LIELDDLIQDLIDGFEAQEALEEWRRNPDSFITWEELEAQLIADGLLDEPDL